MGLFSKKKKKDSSNSTDFLNKKVIDLVPKSEKAIIEKAKNVLSNPTLEEYAIKIVNSYKLHGEDNDEGWNIRESEIRPIGQSINDFNTQLLVAHRAHFLGAQQGTNVYLRELEYYWDGIGGWMS